MEYFASYGDDAEEQSPAEAARVGENASCAPPAATASSFPAAPATSPFLFEHAADAPLPQLLPAKNCAPQVNAFAAAALGIGKGGASDAVYIHPENRLLMTNPKAAALHAAIQGPLTPQQEQQGGWLGVYRRRLGGEVEREHVNVTAFEREYRSYQHYGRATDPSNLSVQELLEASRASLAPERSWGRQGQGDPEGEGGVATGSDRLAVANDRKGFIVEGKKKEKRKRLRNDNAASDDFQGPWAPFVSDAPPPSAASIEEGEEKKESEKDANAGKSDEREEKSGGSGVCAVGADVSAEEKKDSTFHGGGEVDYQGRSWISVPTNWHSDFETLATSSGADSNVCYPPKKEIYSFTGHTGGVQAIRFFPGTGHLILSASMDSTVKIWETEGKRRLRRTYTAHGQAVRDIQWSQLSAGEKFYSCSYDTTIKLWDTERGTVIGTFTNGKTPYCVSVSPQNENIFIIGSANRRAVQFDARSGQIEVEYAEHIGSVNTVTFCEEGKRVVTTADDKKLFVWEFGIPVVIRHVSEPHMHSMPAAAKHPNERYIAYQSMDNQICVFEAHGKYRGVPYKHFRGHVCAGYACHPCFSPDGRWLLSGDSSGKLWVWDWKKGKNTRSYQAHEQVCIDCQWHPARTSRVATCGWDGLIKLWD